MRKLITFNFVTLDGYFKGSNQDISWHNKQGKEENEYAAESLSSKNILLFGRTTYEMMASYWPTPTAIENDPIVAKGMNTADKIVFSRTLKAATWDNTKVIKGNIIEEISKMKLTKGNDMTILGSGSIISQFAEHGLIDEYQIMIDPIAIGNGVSIFSGIKDKLDLTLIKTKIFKSGIVLLCYKAIKNK